MGLLHFALDTQPKQVNPDDSRSIGYSSQIAAGSVTRIFWDDDLNCFMIGPEIKTEQLCRQLEFVRETSGEEQWRRIPFKRLECRFVKANQRRLAQGGHVVLTQLPVGQRNVQFAEVKSAARSLPSGTFEDFTSLPSPYNNRATRIAATDIEAITALHMAKYNLFESGKHLVAAFPSVGMETRQYLKGDLKAGKASAPKWGVIKAELKKTGFAGGLITDPEKVRQSVWRHPTIELLMQRLSNGELFIQIPMSQPVQMKVPEDLYSDATDLMNLSIIQSLGGPGDRKDLVGRPVAHLALQYFRNHIVNLAKRRYAGGDAAPLHGFKPEYNLDAQAFQEYLANEIESEYECDESDEYDMAFIDGINKEVI